VTAMPQYLAMSTTTLGVLASVMHLRTLGSGRALMRRELAAGLSQHACYWGLMAVDGLYVALCPAAFLAVYYNVLLPEAGFGALYLLAAGAWWWVSGMTHVVCALVPARSALVTAVFNALILGAFVNGLNPTVATARGGLLEAVLGCSYSRWAVELGSLLEFDAWSYDRRNAIIMMARGLGFCGLDQVLPDNGDGVLDAHEALALLRVQQSFGPGSCDGYKSTAMVALFVGGLLTRLGAWLLLCVTRHHGFWYS
jgi:hypothetical protein